MTVRRWLLVWLLAAAFLLPGATRTSGAAVDARGIAARHDRPLPAAVAPSAPAGLEASWNRPADAHRVDPLATIGDGAVTAPGQIRAALTDGFGVRPCRAARAVVARAALSRRSPRAPPASA